MVSVFKRSETNWCKTIRTIYGEREAMPTNEQFGRDRSRCFNNKYAAINYFNELSAIIEKELQRAHKSVIELEQVPELISQYQKEAA